MAVCLANGNEQDMPDIEPELIHFVQILFDAGPVSVAGMGPVPLTWTDLEAWQRGAGVNLPPWQARMIRRLSADYIAELQAAEAHDAPPPWQRETTADRREKISKHIRNVLRG